MVPPAWLTQATAATQDPLNIVASSPAIQAPEIEDGLIAPPLPQESADRAQREQESKEDDIVELPAAGAEDDEEQDGRDDGLRRRGGSEGGRARRGSNAPSYAQSEFFEITRRQRVRTHSNTLKLPRHLLAPARSHSPAAPPSQRRGYPPLSRQASVLSASADPPAETGYDKEPPKLPNAWEFAGWGTMSYLELGEEEVAQARERRKEEMKRDGEGTLGPCSPISLLVATLLLSFWRPIMTELAAALPISGANYAYLLNSSPTLTYAIAAAALTLLDDIATSVVAAATAASYIANEGVPGGETWLTLVLLLGIAAIGLVGIKGGAGITLTTLAIHLTTLSILFVAALVHWGQHGNSTLSTNWTSHQLPSGSAIARAIYQGICIAFLGVTGFETAPDYITSLRPAPGVYPTVLRSLQIIAVCINAPLLLVVFAVLPMKEITGNDSVLAALGRRAAGGWLGTLVTVDAVLILSATVLAGLISAIALLQRVSLDGYLPIKLLRPLPVTGAPALVVALFAALCVFVYASSGNSLSVVSNMFALVFLAVMALYPLNLLLLRYNRPTLPRPHLKRRTPFLLILFTLSLALALIAGVAWQQTVSIGYFAAYLLAILALLLAAARKGQLVRLAWWVVSSHGVKWRRAEEACVRWMRRSKEGRTVVLFVKGDEINTLFSRISYVEQNEETACIKLVHFYGSNSTSRRPSLPSIVFPPASLAAGVGEGAKSKEDLEDGEGDGAETPQIGTADSGVDEIPSELEANFRILDEAFPSITIDLLFLQAPFSPSYIHALAQRLGLPVARCFMGSPSERWVDEREFGVRELAGVRVIDD
ncbi:hypothetical protein JCM10213v2_005794 [Rhodosporidiobolus nylandii]